MSTESVRLPRRGAALSKLIAAFRLPRKVEREHGTAKRIYRDDVDVSTEAFEAEVRSVVDGVFATPYLMARGLTEVQSDDHNHNLTVALVRVLSRWEQVATATGVWSVGSEAPTQMLIEVMGVPIDVAVRAAAYERLFGSTHPILRQIPMMWRKPGVREWWAQVTGRAGKEVTAKRLSAATGISKETLRGLERGEVPSGGVLQALARGLSKFDVKSEKGDGVISAAEIEFEARIACAVDAVRRFVASGQYDFAMDLRCFQILRTVMTDDVATEVLVSGVEAPTFPGLLAVTATTKKLTDLCDNPTEMLTVLLHVTASVLSFVTRDMSEADAGKYVGSYLLQITKILDAGANAEASNANR